MANQAMESRSADLDMPGSNGAISRRYLSLDRLVAYFYTWPRLIKYVHTSN